MALMLLPLEGELRRAGDAAALLLAPHGEILFLGFAIATFGGEHEVFPEIVLDDWGSERRGAALYQWIREEGTSFPRAELFGVDLAGAERQFFLRELDLTDRYACYAFPSAAARVEDAIRVRAICRPDDRAISPGPSAPPPGLHVLLGRAAVSWWAVSPATFYDMDIRQLLPLES